MSKKQQILRDLIMGCEGRPLEYPLIDNTTYALGLSPREVLEAHWSRYKKLIDRRSLQSERYGFIRFFEGYHRHRNVNPHFEEIAKHLSKFQLELRVENHGMIIVRQISGKSLSAIIPLNKRKPISDITPRELRDYLITSGEDAIFSEGCLLVCGYNYFFEIGKPIDLDAEIKSEEKWRVSHETEIVSLKELGLS